MRCEALFLFLSVMRVRLRQDCSEEYSRERQLYPLCVPQTCGRVVRDISQAGSHNIKQSVAILIQ